MSAVTDWATQVRRQLQEQEDAIAANARVEAEKLVEAAAVSRAKEATARMQIEEQLVQCLVTCDRFRVRQKLDELRDQMWTAGEVRVYPNPQLSSETWLAQVHGCAGYQLIYEYDVPVEDGYGETWEADGDGGRAGSLWQGTGKYHLAKTETYLQVVATIAGQLRVTSHYRWTAPSIAGIDTTIAIDGRPEEEVDAELVGILTKECALRVSQRILPADLRADSAARWNQLPHTHTVTLPNGLAVCLASGFRQPNR